MKRAALALALAACGDNWVAHGLDQRPANPDCLAPARPARAIGITRVFGAHTFEYPVAIEQTRDGAWWYLAENGGKLWRLSAADPDAAPQLVLDITEAVSTSGYGLVGFTLHPDFADNGELFVTYTGHGGTLFRSLVSRFTSTDGGASFADEELILEIDQQHRHHHNTDLRFGPDGYLYVPMGDGGPQGDPFGHAQDLADLRGKILRLDVDGAAPYAIPDDNPFADGGGRPEIWASGLRNPWRISFDRETGALYAGDVGWNTWEELDRIERGGNYGWNLREGTHCGAIDPCPAPDVIEPLLDYGRDEGKSITAGFVYRGEAIPSLVGRMLVADYILGNIWSVDPEAPADRVLIAADGQGIVSFAEDVSGELLYIDFWQGTLWKIVPGTPGPADVPATLTATGCFEAGGEPAGGLIPYDVNVPFWSDGADKRRWMALPDGATVAVGDDGDLDFPVGSVLIKEFTVAGRRAETRLFARHDDGEWAGYTYVWNDAQTDATLVPFTAEDTVVGGWYYPRRGECLTCHTAQAGRTLGLELAQLERRVTYPSGRTADQLGTLEHIGVFGAALPGEREPLPQGDARGWLHANCSGCHRGGRDPEQPDMDLRFTATLAEMNVCDVPPAHGDLDLADPRRVAPGAPERSVLSARVHGAEGARMPPLATFVVDDDGAALIDAWITSLTGCE